RTNYDNGCSTSTYSLTVTWTEDTEKPVITLAAASALACNPTTAQIAAAFGAASVTDNCSSGITATGTVGAETGGPCTFSTTKSWTVTDGCGNTGTASQTVTYTRDTTKPVITLTAASPLRCNTTTADATAAVRGTTRSADSSGPL